MKLVLPFVLLAFSATAVDAQQPIHAEPTEPTTIEAPTLTRPAAVDLNAPVIPALQAQTDAAADATNDADRLSGEVDAAEAPAAMQDTPRNWWWMVGGIVLAGVILAALL